MRPRIGIARLLALMLTAALVFHSAPLHASTLSQDGPEIGYTYGDCSHLDRAALRAEIEQNALHTLSAQGRGFDASSIVQRQWMALSMDSVIDAEVAKAVAQVGADETYWNRLLSGWSADKAEEYAARIANQAFGSATFRAKIDELSMAIAMAFSHEIQAEFARAASAAFLCLQEYVGEHYSDTLFTLFHNTISADIGGVDMVAQPTVEVSALDVHKGALAGAGIIVVTEVARRISVKLGEKIAQRLAGRIAGRVLGRAGTSIIPVAGWVIGLTLIAWDLWEGAQGALPQIQEALQGSDVKVKIRDEVTAAMESGLPEEVSLVALQMSVELVDQWSRFCDDRQYLCLVAQDSPALRAVLETTPLSEVDRLSRLVDLFMLSVGRGELDASMDNGDLEKLLLLPETAWEILRVTRSPAETLDWSALAGDSIGKVVEYELFRRLSPAELTPQVLAALVGLDDEELIERLLSLQAPEWQALAALPMDALQAIGDRSTDEDLRALADHLLESHQPLSDRLVSDMATGAVSIAEVATLAKAEDDSPDALVATVPHMGALSELSREQGLSYGSSVLVAAAVLLLTLALCAVYIAVQRRRRYRAASR